MADSGDDGHDRDRTTPGEEGGNRDRPPRDREGRVDPTDTESCGGEHRPGAAGSHEPNRAENARTDRRESAATPGTGGYRRRSATGDGDWTGIVEFTVGVVLVFGVGSTLAWFLFVSLAPVGGRTGGGFAADPLFGSLVVALFLGIFLAPLLAVVTGVVAGRRVRGLPGVEQ